MTLSPRDTERARQFQANRQQTRQLERGNTLLELAQLQTAMQHYRTKLVSALESNDSSAANNYISQLITLRATQCALNLRHLRETGQAVDAAVIQAEQTAYAADCARLIAATA